MSDQETIVKPIYYKNQRIFLHYNFTKKCEVGRLHAFAWRGDRYELLPLRAAPALVSSGLREFIVNIRSTFVTQPVGGEFPVSRQPNLNAVKPRAI
jgi:hypothetical protein